MKKELTLELESIAYLNKALIALEKDIQEIKAKRALAISKLDFTRSEGDVILYVNLILEDREFSTHILDNDKEELYYTIGNAVSDKLELPISDAIEELLQQPLEATDVMKVTLEIIKVS